MKLIRIFSLAFLIMTVKGVQACSKPHPYAWMSLLVPEIEFRQAPLTDVVAFLNAFLAKSVTNKPPPRITIAPGTFGANPVNGDKAQEIPLITFTARYVGIGCAIKIIPQVLGMTYEANEAGAVLKFVRDEKDELAGNGNSTAESANPFAPATVAEGSASQIAATSTNAIDILPSHGLRYDTPSEGQKKTLDVVLGRLKFAQQTKAQTRTVDQAVLYLWRTISIAVIQTPRLCTEYRGFFWFSRLDTAGPDDQSFGSGYAVKKGTGEIYRWEEATQAPHP